eukprot:scaffold456402_cov31-Prasinocladus_malaysianus.AAC.1
MWRSTLLGGRGSWRTSTGSRCESLRLLPRRWRGSTGALKRLRSRQLREPQQFLVSPIIYYVLA